ncbi:MAG: pyridoxamine 5'-phosphate oxidase [Flavobacteriales bacterium]|jgi:pyridoxamine 5'-phosphate oxidase|uniref:pyridoxamine 5'-phosphate oxidase n=1 Tax=Blattabacterium sp. (Mastotermes darwiniensis) TaxID=39768 RepID=UPI000231DF13|nr:pyridoxamine 5'-phosphate oxidase [Blattabacterium sp. (Mastotermes darwiniensis)]AER40839.1 pyridoxamine 5'-phosphate oxidase [Blattabacterium sp. (Mastotermes darwiniensis) str. MADAR]MDR1804686.1 pyridoxamine 5'-phosphate oxidase [Flavobacteriales bacterium]
MTFDLYNYRKIYTKKSLMESKVPLDPLTLFHSWFQEEKEVHPPNTETNAMSISTIGEDGVPETRIVLLKMYSKDGFVFYTNYRSFKGLSIHKKPKVCISFYWPNTERQIIIKGKALKLSINKSDEYFYKRPKENQVGCWASKQSSIIPSKDYLLSQYQKWSNFFKEHRIKRPFYWGGYVVKPYKMEFWQGQPHRLHDRLIYEFEKENKWKLYRLSP